MTGRRHPVWLLLRLLGIYAGRHSLESFQSPYRILVCAELEDDSTGWILDELPGRWRIRIWNQQGGSQLRQPTGGILHAEQHRLDDTWFRAVGFKDSAYSGTHALQPNHRKRDYHQRVQPGDRRSCAL